jgi:DNA-binding transcriptional LysR family regulator
MQRDMNLECWRIFATVAQAGSISASLDALDMNAPSVSRTISGLEKSLGTDLFDRSSHPMVLTENGKEALSAALEMLNTHDALLKRLHTNTEEMAGAIRVGVPAALLQSYLVPFFIEFSKKYPEIHLEATEYTAGLPVDFTSKTGTLDLVISYGPDRSHPNYVQIHYGSGRFIPCASPTYLARHGTPQTPEELAKHIGIIFHSPIRSSGTTSTLTKAGRTVPIQFQREIAFNSALSAKNATLFGAGINPAMAELHCYREIQSGALVPILPGWFAFTEELYIYTRPEQLRLKRIRFFIEEYKKAIGELFTEQRSVFHSAQHGQ